ncbi:MAG: hypothetical protein AB1491_00240 [Thermodesulfobacteriota bacterium]
MTDKYLPGPYDVDAPLNPDSAKRITVRRQGVAVAVVYGRKRGEALATARLIAAVPALLAACEWAACSTHHPTCRCTEEPDIGQCDCHVEAARKAIAKVKGQP